jgi:thiol-disulfide isomerase/thioredoxin
VEKAFRKVRFIDMEDSSMTASSAMPASVPDFQSFDVQGKPVSQDLFSGADLTVVNVWGTFCGPCIKEMPELAEWSESLPAGVQLVGLVCDVNSPDDAAGVQEAKAILEKAGVRFTNVLASDDLQVFLSGIQFVPTTFLVDGKGNIIGDPIVGADVRKYKRAVDACLQKK